MGRDCARQNARLHWLHEGDGCARLDRGRRRRRLLDVSGARSGAASSSLDEVVSGEVRRSGDEEVAASASASASGAGSAR